MCLNVGLINAIAYKLNQRDMILCLCIVTSFVLAIISR